MRKLKMLLAGKKKKTFSELALLTNTMYSKHIYFLKLKLLR